MNTDPDTPFAGPIPGLTKTGLTREQIIEMPASLEIDFLIATLIMGFEPWPDPRFKHGVKAKIVPEGILPSPCRPSEYSTDIARAWLIVEKLKSKCIICDTFALIQSETYPGHWNAGFGDSNPGEGFSLNWEQAASAETAPLAICRAALLTTIKS